MKQSYLNTHTFNQLLAQLINYSLEYCEITEFVEFENRDKKIKSLAE